MKETRSARGDNRRTSRPHRTHALDLATMVEDVRQAAIELAYPRPVIVANTAGAAQCPERMVFLRREVIQLHRHGSLSPEALGALCRVKSWFPNARLAPDEAAT